MACRVAGVVVIPHTTGRENDNFLEDFESDYGNSENGTLCPSWTDLITVDHLSECSLDSTIITWIVIVI